MPVCVPGALEGQKRALQCLHLSWSGVLGVKVSSCAGITSAFNC